MTKVTPERRRMPKLLSPVKSFDGTVRVIRAGADEIYCGVRLPALREFELYRGASCEIPNYSELGRVIRHAHDRGVDVILTINQPFMVEAMEKHMRNHIQLCLDEGVDALLIGDMGILSMVKEVDVGIPLYASTYMSSMNNEAIDFMRKLGFNRVVLERHLTVPEISEIVQHSKVDVEVFIHGSGCSNINVNCYLFHFTYPEMVRARLMINGMRYPCALTFGVYDVADREKRLDNIPILDSYTFCSLCRLPELIQIGVGGFKIEGRCEDEEYQEQTTRIYRDLIDMIQLGQMTAFQEKLESLKENFIPAPPSPLNLQEIFCAQKRCYYSSLFHVPYRVPISWRAWTKHQFKFTVSKDEGYVADR